MPTDEQIRRALELIRKPGAGANYVRFFTQLDDPEWLEPLRNEGFFAEPPDVRAVGGGVMYPAWPESGYLLRIVERAPTEVAEVLSGIPLSENSRVHADLARIAARLPARAALAFTSREIAWLADRSGQIPIDLPEAIAELVIHLADLGKSRRAIELSRELLSVRVPAGGDERWRMRVEARMEGWTYQELTRKLLPELQQRVGLAVVELVATLLAEGLAMVGDEEPFDYSGIWRSSIAEEPDYDPEDPRQQLVSGLRDIALAEADEDRGRLDAVLAVLCAHNWTVFDRLEVFLIAEKAPLARDLVRSRLLDREELDYAGAEYTALAAAAFATLEPADRARWISLVDEGPPNPSRVRAEREADEIDEADYERYRGLWMRNWYALVREYLTAEQGGTLAELESRYGAAAPPVTDPGPHVWATGPNSPLSSEQMRELSAHELVGFLKQWTPSEDPMGDTQEGLGRQLSDHVAEQPAAFAEIARQLTDLEPTYVRSVLQGFEKAVKEERALEWEPVVGLIEAAMSGRPIARPKEGRRWLDQDPGWGWARGAIASLLTAALQQDVLPAVLGDRVWRILDELSWDSNPTVEYEQEYGAGNMDPLTLSLNTTRGKAMHAILAFAAWRKKHTDGPFSLDQIAAVGENLADHLVPEREPSETIRGVFGASLPLLRWLDGDWLSTNVARIFPREPEHMRLRRAAWESFLSYGSHVIALFPTLEEDYTWAIEQLPTAEDRRAGAGRDPGLVLGEHLGALYYNGLVDLSTGGLLEQFYGKASLKEQAHVVDYLGRSVNRDEDPIPADVLKRLTELWEWLGSSLPAESRGEVLAGFGWWYGALGLDRDWQDRQLRNLLREHIAVKPEFAVVKGLLAHPPEKLHSSLKLTYLYAQQDKAAWRLLGSQEELRVLLSAGATSKDPAEREQAKDIIDLLAAKGIGDHMDLLEPSRPAD